MLTLGARYNVLVLWKVSALTCVSYLAATGLLHLVIIAGSITTGDFKIVWTRTGMTLMFATFWGASFAIACRISLGAGWHLR
jgi:hypothetical protein